MSIDAAVGVPDVFAPARLGPIAVRNRTIKAATYENLARRRQVTDELIDFHVRQGAGSAQPLPFPPRQTVADAPNDTGMWSRSGNDVPPRGGRSYQGRR